MSYEQSNNENVAALFLAVEIERSHPVVHCVEMNPGVDRVVTTFQIQREKENRCRSKKTKQKEAKSDPPRVETVAGQLLMRPVHALGANDVVFNVVVSQLWIPEKKTKT